MTELLLHERWVREHPTDKVSALALIDHHEESLGVPHRAALRVVAALRHQARTAADLANAAQLLSGTSIVAPILVDLIRQECLVAWRVDAPIIVVPGSRYPRCHGELEMLLPRPARRLSITVGARLVIRLAESVMAEWAEAQQDGIDWFEFAASF